MRADTCERNVTAKIVILHDDQELTLKIDDDVLTKMFGDAITIDDNTLAEKLLFLNNFTVIYDTETLIVSDITPPM
jgi:hypothetical protein